MGGPEGRGGKGRGGKGRGGEGGEREGKGRREGREGGRGNGGLEPPPCEILNTPLDFLVTFHNNHGPNLVSFPRYSEILAENCDFFLSPILLNVPADTRTSYDEFVQYAMAWLTPSSQWLLWRDPPCTFCYLPIVCRVPGCMLPGYTVSYTPSCNGSPNQQFLAATGHVLLTAVPPCE